MLRELDNISLFQKLILDFYVANSRQFEWRYVDDPYKVFISEVMLQQTQTQRVISKYREFIGMFESFSALAAAPLRDVLVVWQGLGYNRRAQYLHQAAQIIVRDFHGVIPQDPTILNQLPGIGPATAASVCAFAFNIPTVFIETNIRSVFIYHFFADQTDVSDAQILPLVQATVDCTNARRWYYALMDYGVMLKQTTKNPNRKSKHYTRQSRFEGSNRQVRGAILKVVSQKKTVLLNELQNFLEFEQKRIDRALQQLIQEELVVICDNYLQIK